MPERNIEFGAYGAQGIKGHELVARRLDSLAGFIASPVTSRRGLAARLRYLTSSARQLAAVREAGLTISDRTIRAQRAETRTPSARTVREIDAAYRSVRRQNVARHLLARLNRQGRGTRVEFHPVNQSAVARPRQRAVEYRTLNVRTWDRSSPPGRPGTTRAWTPRGSTRSWSTSVRSGASASTSPTSASPPEEGYAPRS